MKVRMTTNLGFVHANNIGVDYRDCKTGMVVEVSEAAGQWLVKNRKAVEEIHAVPPVAPMKAVPPEPTKAKSKS
jgi:hypothetical protein